MRYRVRALFSRVFLLGFGMLGCQGSIAADPPKKDPVTGLPVDPATGLPVDPETGKPVDPGTGEPLPPFSPAPIAMRRLTTAQYRNVLQDLLGSVQITVELESDTAVNGFVEIGAALTTISPTAAEKFEDAAFEAGKQAAGPALRDGLVGCKPKAVLDSACTRSFLERFGRRAFRRPLTSEELNRYVGIAEQSAQQLGDFYAGVEFSVAGLLQSPNLLFRVELGEPDPASAGRFRYTNFEMATRLSFLLWNTTPDVQLLDAAAAGKLVNNTGLSEQVERLLADPRARKAMNNFQFERLGLEALDVLDKDRGLYPSFSPGLAASMRDDILRSIDHVVFEQGADFRDLFDTRVSFVDGGLAGVYGVTKPASGVAQAVLPGDGVRLGLLGKAGILAMNAHVRETSPTLRGKFVRERLLCQTIAAPPPTVITILPAPNPNAATMRERLASHRNNPSCANCHEAMDPIGLAFENFDAMGAFRTTDNGHALDLSGKLGDSAFDGPVQLASILKADPAVSECAVRQLYRYATGHVELEGEEVIVKSLTQRFANSGYRIPELLKAVVVSEGFRYLKQSAP